MNKEDNSDLDIVINSDTNSSETTNIEQPKNSPMMEGIQENLEEKEPNENENEKMIDMKKKSNKEKDSEPVVIEGNLEMAFDMIQEAIDASYDPSFVFDADDFAVSMICDNYLYPPSGIREVLNKAEQEENTDFLWLNNKPPSLIYSKPPDFTLETRNINLELLETPCIDNEIEPNTTYQSMVNLLP